MYTRGFGANYILNHRVRAGCPYGIAFVSCMVDMTESPDNQAPIGLIAGGGRLPVLTAEGIRAAGRRVACVGLAGHYEPALPGLSDMFAKAGIIQMGRWIRLLRRFGVSEAVIIGRVNKARMYQPLRLFRQLPDWRTMKLWYRVTRYDKRSAALLTAGADMIGEGGIELIDTTRYIPECMADEGVLTRCKPTGEQLADIEFAWPVVKRLGELDIGQGIAVKEREVIAVEAIEGTDAMIRRAGELCRRGRWTLIKVARPGHDMRFDVPTVGPVTIERMHECGGTCLAIEAGKVILADKAQFLELADRYRIAVVGRRI